MSAIEALRRAQEASVRVAVKGDDLILEADREPSSRLLDDIRRYKAEIISVLKTPEGDWSSEDWGAFFDERAGIAEFDGGQNRADAEAIALEWCIAEWLNRYPERSDPDRCACCQRPDRNGHAIVPFGTETDGHTWLHPGCWNDWYRNQRQKAEKALINYGLNAPVKTGTSTV